MINVRKKEDCCGCTACASICSHEAISMKSDELGFMYPMVDTNKCVDCGLCEKVCAFNENYDKTQNLATPIAYAARHKNLNEVLDSRSGAVFVAISDYILMQGGIVYGVGYTGHFRVAHKRAVTKKERDEFRGSKYVQSDLKDVFLTIRDDLKENRIVLFTGTPCQTAGLNAYIGKKLRKNLLLIDIVCHGVSSPRMWKDYIHYLEEQEKSIITSVDFRDKKLFGWDQHRESFVFQGKKEKKVFKQRFYQDYCFRDSCYNCHFCNISRPSDITIGDFWGWKKLGWDINEDNKGLNLVLLNTEKGKDFFSYILKDLTCRPAAVNQYLQPNLIHPTPKSKKRNELLKDIQKYGMLYVLKKDYNKASLFRRMIRRLYSFFKYY